ncbi:MAG: histidine kinase [Flavobacteriales bacterium]|nr:histidine kinase [Flavobacteriales bacterium]
MGRKEDERIDEGLRAKENLIVLEYMEIIKENMRGAENRKPPYGLIFPFTKFRYYFLALLLCTTLFNLIFWPNIYDNWRGAFIGTMWSGAHWLTQSLGNGYVGYLISQRISWLDRPWARASADFFGLMLYSVSAFVIVQTSFMYLWNGELPTDLWTFVIKNSRIALVISFSIAFILTTVGFLKNWKESALEAEKLKAEMMTYKYESLRNQINPHFLFNSLNVLTELVQEDKDQAVKFIRQLSDLYRYVLDSRERQVVPLKEEIDFIHSFAYLLETRFEDKLHVDLDIESKEDECIVPMALQNLVENAVKHNETSKEHPLHVKIYRNGERIYVENPMRKKKVGENSKGTGLANVKARYSYLSDQEIKISDEGGKFKISLPILKVERI